MIFASLFPTKRDTRCQPTVPLGQDAPRMPSSQCIVKLGMRLVRRKTPHTRQIAEGGLDKRPLDREVAVTCKLHATQRQPSHSGQWWEAGGDTTRASSWDYQAGEVPHQASSALWKSLPRTCSHEDRPCTPYPSPTTQLHLVLAQQTASNAAPRWGTKGTIPVLSSAVGHLALTLI